jgi:D-sedoheptulose 7-phosphate isomerase
MLAGNGASAGIASHYALDFTKQASVRSTAFNDASLVTAYGNDYGYENWVARAIEHHADGGDAAILISSSGRSENMVKAAEACSSRNVTVLTFTGFERDNPLRERGEINFWADSRAYNVVEAVHAAWLGILCDMLVGKREYPVST